MKRFPNNLGVTGDNNPYPQEPTVPHPPVLFEVKDTIGRITLNRPENRNSMDRELLPAFEQAVEKAISLDDLRCLIITGSGKTFCAGADFKGRQLPGDRRLPHDDFYEVYRPFLRVLDVEVPTIAAMNGHAIGGGLGLALVCDLRIASRDSRYGANFVRLGLHSGMAVSYILPRLVGLPRAAELLLTGRIMSGQEAALLGLANYCEEPGAVLARAQELAGEIAGCAPAAVRMMKRSIYRGLEWDPRGAAHWEAHCQSRTMETEDAKEGITALLEKRAPVFKGR